jgi:hypothetical protein
MGFLFRPHSLVSAFPIIFRTPPAGKDKRDRQHSRGQCCLSLRHGSPCRQATKNQRGRSLFQKPQGLLHRSFSDHHEPCENRGPLPGESSSPVRARWNSPDCDSSHLNGHHDNRCASGFQQKSLDIFQKAGRGGRQARVLDHPDRATFARSPCPGAARPRIAEADHLRPFGNCRWAGK